VLAVAILGMAALCFFPVFNQMLVFTKEIRDYSILAGLGEQLVHDYLVQVNGLAPGAALGLVESDITPMVRSTYPNAVFDSFSSFKVVATVRPTALCVNGGYEILIRIHWKNEGIPREFSLFTVKAARE